MLKIEADILEPVAIAWFVMLLAKPVVVFKSQPEMQHHCWGKGKINVLLLPFLPYI